MRTRRFLWVAHPARALVEAWLIGLVILFLLTLQVGYVAPVVLGNGLLFLCGTCGMWAVLRTRIPKGGWLRQGAWELAVGFSLSLVMLAGIRIPARLLGWDEVWIQSNMANDALVSLLLSGYRSGLPCRPRWRASLACLGPSAPQAPALGSHPRTPGCRRGDCHLCAH